MAKSNFLKVVLGIIATAIIVYILKTLKTIFIPLTFAIFLSFIFAPFNRFLIKKKVPISLILLIMVIIILISFTLTGTVVYTSVSSFVTEFPKYEEKMTNLIQDFITEFEIPVEQVKNYLNNKVNWVEIADKLSFTKVISATMGNFIDFFIKLLLTVVFMLFIVLERNKLFHRVEKVITEKDVLHSLNVIAKIEGQVRKYLVNKTFISLATALVSMLFLYAYGIDFVIIAGLFIFILNFIPNIGSIIASAFPMIICFFQFGLSWQLIAVVITLPSIQMTFGNVIEPRLMGTGLNLSPIIILISLIFWYWIWGPVGMILAIPITSAMNLIFKEIDSMKIVSAFISGD